MGSGIGYQKRGTLGGLAIGGGNASVVMIRRYRVPITPKWSKKVVWTVTVSSIWREMRPRFHMVRWTMHDSWPGCWRVVKVWRMDPSHPWYGRRAMCASFEDECFHPPGSSPPKMKRECGWVWGSCARAAHVGECASTVWGR